ncbi:MAG: hypothetical protein JXN64_10935 [Spirochaetes bacterium]|nr:hypothetical protein [Spirochaetota bacterium]
MENSKEIMLISFANKVYNGKLDSKGFQIIEFEQPLNDESISGIGRKNFKGTAVIEVIEDAMQGLAEVIDGLRKNSVRVIALAAKINNIFRDYFFKHGIAEVLESNNAERIADYIDISEKYSNKMYGKLLVLDDDSQRINIFNTIISRFNYSPVIVDSIDKLFENISVNIQFILVNLGTKNFDLNYFLRRSFSSEMYKKIPVILFKEKIDDLYIHEMISGLNKVAKIILTAGELYSFLVDILFRKELSPGVNLLTEALDTDNLNRFASEPLSRLYNIIGTNIFTLKKIITKDNISIIEGRIESLKNLIIKVDGLKWLIKDDAPGKSSIG